MDVPYFIIKEQLWMSASDKAILKKILGVSKSSSRLTLKTKWYHSCGCCEQLKKCVTDKYFEKNLDFEP